MRSLLVVSCVAVFATVGCGQGSPLSTSGSLGTIVGPTALTADGEIDMAAASSLPDAFDTLRGKDKGKGGDKGKDAEKDRGKADDDDVAGADDDEGKHADKPRRGSLSGFVTAVSATTITVREVVVTVNADTEIRHGDRELTMANIQVGDKVQVKGTSTTTTTGTTFTATEIKVEDMDHEGDDDEGDDATDAKVEGKISGLTQATPSTCPVLTFNVVSGTTTVTTTKVTTNNLTKFDDVLCTALANDKVVEVKGTKQTDGSIVATRISLED
jgi:hypothetical protein